MVEICLIVGLCAVISQWMAVAHACDPRTLEAEAAGGTLKTQGQLGPQSEFQVT